MGGRAGPFQNVQRVAHIVGDKGRAPLAHALVFAQKPVQVMMNAGL
jgi:hypothetical protein